MFCHDLYLNNDLWIDFVITCRAVSGNEILPAPGHPGGQLTFYFPASQLVLSFHGSARLMFEIIRSTLYP
jgi:hypothetical protein